MNVTVLTQFEVQYVHVLLTMLSITTQEWVVVLIRCTIASFGIHCITISPIVTGIYCTASVSVIPGIYLLHS